jgi:hypothetical protein
MLKGVPHDLMIQDWELLLDNPQVQGIGVAHINVEVMSIESQEQEGKSIYSLRLECHNSSYLCTTQNKETSDIDLIVENNKVIKVKKNQRCHNP